MFLKASSTLVESKAEVSMKDKLFFSERENICPGESAGGGGEGGPLYPPLGDRGCLSAHLAQEMKGWGRRGRMEMPTPAAMGTAREDAPGAGELPAFQMLLGCFSQSLALRSVAPRGPGQSRWPGLTPSSPLAMPSGLACAHLRRRGPRPWARPAGGAGRSCCPPA